MPAVLPYRFRFAHHYAVFLHDLIVGKLKTGTESKIFRTSIPLTGDQFDSFNGLQGKALYQWLENNCEPEVLLETDYKMLVEALVADMCHYVFEALNASRKGKLTVTFTLLRKPFQDSLFYLEWMLADLPDFFKHFRHGTARDISIKDMSVERRKEIISKAIEALKKPHTIKPDFIYDVRYNRATAYSLAGFSDKAIHLVTTNPHLLTSPQNLNLIFSNPQECEAQWAHIYLIVPQLLYHAVCMIEEILAKLARWDDGWESWISVRREAGLLLYMDSVIDSSKEEDGSSAERIELAGDLLRILLDHIGPSCPQCGNELPLHLRNMRQFCLRGALRCTTCRDTVQFEFDLPQ